MDGALCLQAGKHCNYRAFRRNAITSNNLLPAASDTSATIDRSGVINAEVLAFAYLLHREGSMSAMGAMAQNSLAGGASYVTETSAKPGCRAAVLHIVRESSALSGVVFFKDGSGVSSVVGSTDGKTFQWTMASLSDIGPKGDVIGQISQQGALHAKLAGTNCTLEKSVPQYNEYSNG